MYLKDIWPTSHEIAAVSQYARDPEVYRRLYGNVANANPMWGRIAGASGQVYNWPTSTYIAKPPFFDGFTMKPAATTDIKGARALGIFGDSVTTDHISPAGAIKENSPAGKWLVEHGVPKVDFNSYGSRRGNHEVMMRGTFANVRIKNLMIPPRADGTREEGGVTLFQPSGGQDVHLRRRDEVHRAGHADGRVRRRGIRHRLVARLGGQGHAAPRRQGGRSRRASSASIAPTSSAWACCRCSSRAPTSAQSLGITGEETFDIVVPKDIRPQQDLTLVITRKDGTRQGTSTVLCRIDTPIEVDYYNGGGILPFVLRELMAA